jgi:hypothetical protein
MKHLAAIVPFARIAGITLLADHRHLGVRHLCFHSNQRPSYGRVSNCWLHYCTHLATIKILSPDALEKCL